MHLLATVLVSLTLLISAAFTKGSGALVIASFLALLFGIIVGLVHRRGV